MEAEDQSAQAIDPSTGAIDKHKTSAKPPRPRAPAPPTQPPMKQHAWVETIAILLPIGVGIAVAFIPNIVYAPVQKVAVFFVLSLCPAVLLADRATAKFEMKLPGMVFTAGGAAALLLGTMFALEHLSKPEQQIAVFEIKGVNGSAFPLQAAQVKLHADAVTALVPSYFTDGNTMILIFPEQLPSVTMTIKDPLSQTEYSGEVPYAGNRTRELRLGNELK